MLPFILLACLTSLTQAQNPGLVISRGYSDMSALIKKNTPGLFTNLVIAPPDTLTFETRDFITQVTVTLTNLVLKDFIVQSSNLNVTFNPIQDSVGLKVSNFTCNIYSNYSEIGFNINKTGTAITTFSGSSMIVNILLYYENGHLDYLPDYTNFTMFIVNSATISDTLSSSIISAVNTNMRNYWNLPQNQESIVKQMDINVDEYVNTLNYNYDVPGTLIYLNGELASNVIKIEETYVSSQLNGSFEVTGMDIPINQLQPIVLPFRYRPDSYAGMTQVIVSNYTLFSYFTAWNSYNPAINATSLPSGYPNFLTTNNGYFPELLAVYGSRNLSLTTSINGSPMVFVMNRGILVRMSLKGQLMLMNAAGFYQPELNFTYVFDYMCTPLIKGVLIKGACNNPRSVKFNIISMVTTVSSLGVKRFINDLIQYSFFAGNTDFYFPTVPLSYPNGTTFQNYFVDYSQNYFVISYMPIYKV